MMNEIPITKLCGHEGAKPRKALVQSIRDQGFLPAFPIVVTPAGDEADIIGADIIGADQTGGYQILDGRRRTAAALQAGLETVLAVITAGDAALTILAHATRSENPVAELRAYQELQRAGMSEEQIARAGYATLGRIRKIAKLNQLVPPIAARVECGEIAPGVAFQITRLAPEIQHELAEEEKISGPLVREYQYARRQAAKLSVPGLEQIFEPPPQAAIEDVLAALSEETLHAILAEMPAGERFITWRAKVRKALAARFDVTSDLVLHAKQTV
jgi:ParB-like chromosome segregation protein Spo0J